MANPLQFILTIKALDGTEWQLPYSSLSLADEKNKDRLCNFTIERQVAEAVEENTGVDLEFILSGGYRDVYVHDQYGTLLYSGFVDDLTFSAGKTELGSIQVTSKGYLYLFEKRYTDDLVEFTSEDAGAIAWQLIEATQAKPFGDFGITEGLIEASKDRDRTYRRREIKDAIMQLSSDNVKDGFDFEIDVFKAFNVFYPSKGEERPEIIFHSRHNIDTYQVRKTGIMGMCNHVIVFGEGNGDDMVVVEKDSADSYKEAYFLLEDGLSDKDNGDVDLLGDKGEKYISKFQAPEKTPITINCFYESPLYTSYNVGDRVKVIIPECGIDGFMQVSKKSVNMAGDVQVIVRSYE